MSGSSAVIRMINDNKISSLTKLSVVNLMPSTGPILSQGKPRMLSYILLKVVETRAQMTTDRLFPCLVKYIDLTRPGSRTSWTGALSPTEAQRFFFFRWGESAERYECSRLCACTHLVQWLYITNVSNLCGGERDWVVKRTFGLIPRIPGLNSKLYFPLQKKFSFTVTLCLEFKFRHF